MIQCTGCTISYSPGCAVCPRCGTSTPFGPRRAYLEADAIRRVHASENPPLVRADLLANGFSDLEADEIIQVAVRKLRGETRRLGLLRFLIGTAMVVLGAIAVLGGVVGQARGNARSYLFLGGGAMFCVGLLACFSGAISTLTGRTPPIGPRVSDHNSDLSD